MVLASVLDLIAVGAIVARYMAERSNRQRGFRTDRRAHVAGALSFTSIHGSTMRDWP